MSKQVYFVIDKDGDALCFEDDEKFNSYYKVNPDVQVYQGTRVEVELVPAQVVVKGGGTKGKTNRARGPRPRDAQNRPLKADGTPFAPRGSKKTTETNSATAN